MQTHLFAFLFLLLALFFLLYFFRSPPQVTGQVNSPALIWLLEQFAAMERALGDECIIILPVESPRTTQCLCDDAYGLELCTGITDALLVDGKGLRKELVSDLFKAALIRDGSARDE